MHPKHPRCRGQAEGLAEDGPGSSPLELAPGGQRRTQKPLARPSHCHIRQGSSPGSAARLPCPRHSRGLPKTRTLE